MIGHRRIALAVLIGMLISPLFVDLHAQAARGATPVACAVSAATCTSTNASGDLQIAWAGRDGSSTAPSLASGWTNVGTQGINGTSSADSSVRLACRVATSANQSVGTFTNAGKLIIVNYTGYRAGTTATCASTILGSPSFFASTINTTPTTETFNTVTNSDSSSWDAAFGFCSACTAGIGTAPATMTNNTSVAGPPAVGAHDTSGPTAGFTTANVTLTTGGRIITAVVEIKATQVATPTFDNDGGSYNSAVNVAISDTTPGASIVYCTDTTNTCTPSTEYTSPVAISVSGTYLRAQATATGLAASAIKSAGYSICSGDCPALVQDEAWGTNDGGKTGRYWYYSLPYASLGGSDTQGDSSNNLLACGVSYASGGTPSITDDKGNTWDCTHSTNSTDYGAALCYVAGAKRGTQNLSLDLGAAVYDVHFRCSEFSNVEVSSPVDASAVTTAGSGSTAPNVATAAMTTNVDKDLVYLYGNVGVGKCCNSTVTNYGVGSGFTLLTNDRKTGHFAEYAVQGIHGAITPAMTVTGSTEPWNGVAIAFKPHAGYGTPRPAGIRIVHLYHYSPPTPGSGTRGTAVVQFPCVPGESNAFVATSSTAPEQYDVTACTGASTCGITDSDGNTYTEFSMAGNPQLQWATNAACTNPNTRTLSISYLDHGSPNPMWIYDVVGAATDSYDATMGVVHASGNQTSKALNSTACDTRAGVISQMNMTPTIDNGIVFVAENNGEGPEACVVGTNNVFDSAWFQTEDDACCGILDSSSGAMHIPYTTAAQQQAIFGWANSAAGAPSGWAMGAIALHAPVSTPSSGRKRVIVIQ